MSVYVPKYLKYYRDAACCRAAVFHLCHASNT